MHINAVKVPFNGFAIAFKTLSGHCDIKYLKNVAKGGKIFQSPPFPKRSMKLW